MMKFSIIIVNYRSWKPLRKCLDSIINQGVNSEIIVVDNENNINENKKKVESKNNNKPLN